MKNFMNLEEIEIYQMVIIPHTHSHIKLKIKDFESKSELIEPLIFIKKFKVK